MEGNGNNPQSQKGSSQVGEQPEIGQEVGLEFDPKNRPTGIQAMCLVNMAGRPIIRLLVQGSDDRTLMDSSQDLEDTLALGAFIVEAAADMLEDVSKLLKDNVWRTGIGEHFESYVEQAEDATQRIRKRLSAEPS